MVIGVEIIDKPPSGIYEETIFDIKSSWRSAYWGFVKFTNDDFIEWCGQFRGVVLGVEISKRYDNVLILTTDAMYLLNRLTYKVIDIDDEHYFKQLTISPFGDYILANSYEIVIVTDSIKEPREIEIKHGVCSIELIKWEQNNLIINCEEFIESGDFINISLDTESYKIT